MCERASALNDSFTQNPPCIFQMGGMDCVIVLDCEEDFAKNKAGSKLDELESYKTETLPSLAHYEEQNKLEYVSWSRFENYL